MLILFLLSSIIYQDTTLILKPAEKVFKIRIALAGEVSILKGEPGRVRIKADYPDSLRSKFKILSKGEEVYIGFPEDSTEAEHYKFHFHYQRKEIEKKEREWSIVGRDWKKIKPLRFELYLPEDIPLDLKIGLGEAENDAKLGGFRIRRLEYILGAGEGRVSFEKENREEMEDAYFAIGGAKLKIEKLGNANPKKVEINGGVAKLKLDLGGRWKKRSEIELSFALGDVGIKAPKGLEIATEKEGVVNLGFPKLSSEDPRVKLHFKGAFNLLDFERY